MGSKHLDTSHESGAVTGLVTEVELGTSQSACSSHHLLCPLSSWHVKPVCVQQSSMADIAMC